MIHPTKLLASQTSNMGMGIESFPAADPAATKVLAAWIDVSRWESRGRCRAASPCRLSQIAAYVSGKAYFVKSEKVTKKWS